MRRLFTTLGGVALVVVLATPAWADTAPKPATHTITTHGDEGHHRYHPRSRDRDGNSYQGTSAQGSDDPPGEGRSHYDKLHHDDDSSLF